MFKHLILASVLLSSHQAFSSITSASIFKESKSTNPGVISQRPAATLSMLGKKDTIKIEQADLSAGVLGSGSKFESSIDIINYSLFYGGKGGGITSEVLFETGAGGKTDKLTQTATDIVEYETESKLSILDLGFGIFEGFGISVIRIGAEDKQSYSAVINSQAVNVDSTTEIALTAITIGATFNLGLDFGLFYQKADVELDTDLEFADSSGDDTQNNDRFGLGVGIASKSFRAEVGYIQNVEAQDQGDTKNTPSMVEFTVEAVFGKLNLGYTGRYLMEGFYMYQNVLYNSLAYQGNSENRLENSFNFSYGSDSSGHSFSGSYSAGSVESEQGQQIIDSSTTKYTTVTTSQSMSLSYSYIF